MEQHSTLSLAPNVAMKPRQEVWSSSVKILRKHIRRGIGEDNLNLKCDHTSKEFPIFFLWCSQARSNAVCSLEVGIGVDSSSSRKPSNSDFRVGKGSANAERE